MYTYHLYGIKACIIVTPAAQNIKINFALFLKRNRLKKYEMLIVSFFLQTLLNEQQLYWASIIPMYIVLVVTTFLAFKVAGGQFSKVVSCLKCSKFPQTVQVPAPEN